MREIKFRGRRVDNGEWVEGDLIQLFGGRKYIIDNKFGACIDKIGNFINTGYPFVNDVIPETVGQFTGLKDKNGKEIYEGDIVRSANGRCTATIKFGECCPPPVKRFCEFHGIETHKIYCLHAYDKNGEYLIEDNISFKVIGNIYDKEEINNG